MVKIAVAGGSGNVGQEIIDALVATKKHEILLLSRKDAPPAGETVPGVTWVKADYGSLELLAEILQGVDTVLSFIVAHSDLGNTSQKNLIDAAVRAGVRRFAPSEWASSRFDHMPWYDGKAEMREYLKNLNKDKKVLEYTLFQPGLFVNYLTYPYKSTKHIQPMATPIDFGSRRFLMVEGGDDARITLTTAEDTAKVIIRAIEYEGEWPVVSGIKGDEVTLGKLVEIGERVRGGSFHVERLKADDLQAGVVKSSWVPKAEHPSFTPEQREAFTMQLTAGIVLGMSAEAFSVSDEWNQLLPDYTFTKAEDFLVDAWRGKP
ncbi:hypothetical protein C8A00DRAFT_16647 [Chaetomidium leptoderma]|uniref:NmrA-like domain-containing protein n=1 Tax=Chaetomidium leptoderma TaxID=669021 RepID=A0AAN6VKD1_9PEZI|nr:hypothetical protein C8A00DRAFT_16647 [Chaetomidium leptoderma]